jgi:hypothetical protein
MTPEDFIARLEQILQDRGSGGPRLGGNIDDNIKNLEAFLKQIKQNTSSLSVVNRLIDGQRSALVNVTRELRELDEQINATSDDMEQERLREQRREIARSQVYRNTGIALANFSLTMTKSAGQIGASVANMTNQMAQGLQGTGSSIQLAGTLLKTGISASTQVLSGLAGAVKGAGQALTAFGPIAGAFGTALNALGTAAGAVVGALGSAAGAIAEILINEIEKTQQSFFSASRAGALFADGMMGLRTAATNGTMTLSQFADVIAKHSGDIAQAGLGITEGAKRIGGALAAGGTSMRRELFNLGFSFEEQGGLVAETMRMLAASGDPLRISNRELSVQTTEYARNVRLLAAYTGEDLRKKADEARKQEGLLALQAKLAAMEPKARENFLLKFRSLDEQSRTNLIEMMQFGGIINRRGAAMAATSEAYNQLQRRALRALNDGNVQGVAGMEAVMAQGKSAVRTSLLSQKAFADAQIAGIGGLVGDVASGFGDFLQYLAPRDPESLKKAEENAKQAEKTQNSFNSVIFAFTELVQQLKIRFEGELTNIIQSVLDFVQGPLIGLTRQFTELYNTMQQSGGLLKWLEGQAAQVKEQVTDTARQAAGAAGAVTVGSYGLQAGLAIGTAVAPGIGTVIGGVIGTVLGGLVGYFGGRSLVPDAKPAKAVDPNTLMGYQSPESQARAVGGPVQPFQTYLVGERGPEMLKMGSSSGEVVSNAALTTGAGSAMNMDIRSVLQDILSQNKISNELAQLQMRQIDELKSINQHMLNNSYT